jgi:hypothetical protein
MLVASSNYKRRVSNVNLLASEDDKICDWFFLPEKATMHDEIQFDLLQYEGKLKTGNWSISSSDFENWVRYPQQFLLLHGRSK